MLCVLGTYLTVYLLVKLLNCVWIILCIVELVNTLSVLQPHEFHSYLIYIECSMNVYSFAILLFGWKKSCSL